MYAVVVAVLFDIVGIISKLHGFGVWKFVKYIKEELRIVLLPLCLWWAADLDMQHLHAGLNSPSADEGMHQKSCWISK